MADGWNELQNDFSKKKNVTSKRRQLELVTRAEAVREMYHQVVESLLDLYKDGSTDLRSWQNFRTVADKLTEIYKFMKFTVSKLYELGTLEGAASYSAEFFGKLRELSESGNLQDVPFEYLRDYLSEPGDPPPRSLHTHRRRRRRAKRIAIRYHSPTPVETASDSRPWLSSNLMIPTTTTTPTAHRMDSCNDRTSLPSPPMFPSSSSLPPCSPLLEDPATKRARLSPVVNSRFTPSASFGATESESGLSEDSAASSVSGSSSCLCGVDPDGDCLTDCSSSTTTTNDDDDDTDSVHCQTPSSCHSS